jgi:hypothetical protein
MVRDDCMQHADDGDRENEEDSRSCCGTGQHGGLKDIPDYALPSVTKRLIAERKFRVVS